MARPNFFIVASNTAPGYDITCQRAGTDIDLTGATVIVELYNKSTKQVTNSTNQSAGTVVKTATAGLIEYTAISSDFPTKGTYVADIKVTYAAGGIERLYNQATWKVRNTGV